MAQKTNCSDHMKPPRIDKETLKIALLTTAITVGPLVVIAWLGFPGRPVAWILLVCALVMVGIFYYLTLSRSEQDLKKLHDWYETKTGSLVLRIIFAIMGIVCTIYAIQNDSLLAGIFAIAAFASLWKPTGW